MIKLKSETGMRACGKCGTIAPAGEAHNARTCGKTVIPKQTPTPHLKTSPEQPQGGRVEWEGLMEKVNNVEKTDNDVHRTEKGKELYDADNNYTAAELKTLWELMNGNKGKQGKNGEPANWNENVDFLDLKKFVEETHALFPNLSPNVWQKFFQQFGVEAKTSLLDGYEWEPSPDEEILQGENLDVLPEKFFHIFQKDPYQRVRDVLIYLKGFPEDM